MEGFEKKVLFFGDMEQNPLVKLAWIVVIIFLV